MIFTAHQILFGW